MTRLAYIPPLAIDRLFGFLATRAVTGFERVDGARYARSMRTTDGHPVVVELETVPDTAAFEVRMTAVGDRAPQRQHDVVRAVRRMLDLDADPSAIDGVLMTDPVVRPLVAAAPGTRVPRTTDGFELAVRGIVGQQVSVTGARTTLGRIVDRFGDRIDPPIGGVSHLFPTAERLTDAPPDAFGMPAARADAIRRLAGAVAIGEIDLSGGAELDATLQALRSIKGIGTWTVDYIAMRALGDGDAFLVGDLGVRRGFATLGLPDDARSMLEHAERWRPWRAYAAIHLWQSGPR